MLNYEYARLVEQDRRREIAERIRIERALHPDDGLVNPQSRHDRRFTPRAGSVDDAGRGDPCA